MKKTKWIIPLTLMLFLGGGSISGCVTTGDGEQGIEALESMSDLEYSKWQLYIQLGVKIAANRSIVEGLVSENELNTAATVLMTLRDQTIVPGATSLIQPALEEAGLTNDEVQLLLLIVEQELLSRGALDWIDPTTGLVALSPRTKEMLEMIANSLRAATSVTSSEQSRGEALEQQFNGQII